MISKKVKKAIDTLKELQITELSEREFYHKVIEVISELGSISEEEHEALLETFKEIGCTDYKTWKAEKKEKGEIVEETTIGKGIEQADIGTAVAFVDQFFYDYESASFGLAKMNDGWTEEWLENSEKILAAEQLTEMDKEEKIELTREDAVEVQLTTANLDKVIEELLDYKERGISVYTVFSGVKLYSADITVDSAYLAVTGETKADYDRLVAEKRENDRKAKEERKAEVEKSIPDWIERGKRIIQPERLEEWRDTVESSAYGFSQGRSVEDALEIMEALENGASLEEVAQIFNSQGHSGTSAMLIQSIVVKYSKKGDRFKDAMNVKSHTSKSVRKTGKDTLSREGAVKLDEYLYNIDNAVKVLQEYQERGESVYVEFNGHKLYSADITLDGAYKEITGKTKAEFDKAQEEWRERYEKEEAEREAQAKQSIPGWIERGEKLIYPERLDEWKECVEARATDLYHGSDLEAALEIMEALENGATLDEAKEIFDKQDHSGASAGMVRSILFGFSNRGPEFWEHTAYGEISPENRQALDEKIKENEELAAKHSQDIDKVAEEIHNAEDLSNLSVEELEKISQGLDDEIAQKQTEIDDKKKQLLIQRITSKRDRLAELEKEEQQLTEQIKNQPTKGPQK